MHPDKSQSPESARPTLAEVLQHLQMAVWYWQCAVDGVARGVPAGPTERDDLQAAQQVLEAYGISKADGDQVLSLAEIDARLNPPAAPTEACPHHYVLPDGCDGHTERVAAMQAAKARREAE